MSKSPKAVEVTFAEVTPIGRRRLDPYSSRFVAVGESYIIDSKKAQTLADLGEVEILNENVPSPWAKPEVKAPVKPSSPAKE